MAATRYSYNVSNHRSWNYFSSLYISCSALTDTGLSNTNFGNQFNYFGYVIILMLMQIGGLGFMSLKILIFWAILKKFNFGDKLFIESEKGMSKSGYSISMIKITIIFFLSVEFVSTMIFSGYLYSDNFHYGNNISLYHNYGKSLFFSLFTTISASNNAGFDIFGQYTLNGTYEKSSSIQFWNNSTFPLLYISFLMIIGGIGFPFYYECYLWFMSKLHKSKRNYLFSFQCKFTVYSYIILTIFAFLIFLLTVYSTSHTTSNSGFGSLATNKKVLNIFFISLAARNSGFSTINVHLLPNSSKFILTILMWIGASPFSTGGGIRSTTVLLILISIFCYFFGVKQTKFAKRTINQDIVYRSYVIATFSILLIFINLFATILWMNFSSSLDSNYIYNNFSFYDISFDIASSFGTCGLSSGITQFLPWYFLLFSMFLMIVGQLTISSTLLLFKERKNNKANLYESIHQEVMIG